jgi:hypothetical protein
MKACAAGYALTYATTLKLQLVIKDWISSKQYVRIKFVPQKKHITYPPQSATS